MVVGRPLPLWCWCCLLLAFPPGRAEIQIKYIQLSRALGRNSKERPHITFHVWNIHTHAPAIMIVLTTQQTCAHMHTHYSLAGTMRRMRTRYVMQKKIPHMSHSPLTYTQETCSPDKFVHWHCKFHPHSGRNRDPHTHTHRRHQHHHPVNAAFITPHAHTLTLCGTHTRAHRLDTCARSLFTL